MRFGNNEKSLLSSYRGKKRGGGDFRRIWIPWACAALLGVLLIGMWGIGMAKKEAEEIWDDAGLFSWDSAVMDAEQRAGLFDLMEQHELTVLYQHISSATQTKLVQEFLAAASERGVTVWLLTGDPSWGLDPNGTRMAEEAQRVSGYHVGLPEEYRFAGILMDCEPYLMEEWDEEPDEVMESWVSAMAQGRRAANEQGLLFSACIPYYLDSQGYQSQLKELVQSGCDALTVMNYYKENEIAHIQTEVALARTEGRPVTVIYEMQEPGVHGLTGVNTYYHDGLEAVRKSWQAITGELGTEGLSVALHEYKALREVIGFE